MHFNLKRPCANCPFRTDKEEQSGWLGEERAEDIIDAITRRQGTFSCHKTNIQDDGELQETRDSEHCAGALILLEKMGRPNQLMRISERLGFYDRTKLDMESPVFDTPEGFIEWHAY